MLIAMAAKTAFVDLPKKVDDYLHPAPATAVSEDMKPTFSAVVSVAEASGLFQAQQ
ncbi:MAG: hypothetical protein GY826_42370 [Fuerstiella sp.]|nr:hypothetical protein [Fuerstiella sp.]